MGPTFIPTVAVVDPGGDEVCYDAPLLAPRQRDDVIAVAAADRGDRGALARAKMQTLGCAKQDRKVRRSKAFKTSVG